VKFGYLIYQYIVLTIDDTLVPAFIRLLKFITFYELVITIRHYYLHIISYLYYVIVTLALLSIALLSVLIL